MKLILRAQRVGLLGREAAIGEALAREAEQRVGRGVLRELVAAGAVLAEHHASRRCSANSTAAASLALLGSQSMSRTLGFVTSAENMAL